MRIIAPSSRVELKMAIAALIVIALAIGIAVFVKCLIAVEAAPACSQGAGAEPGDDVVALRREEVAIAGARNPRAGGERSPAQHLARIEPRLRIVFVRVRGETRKRHEIRRRPFPYIAYHLAASERAVALGAAGDIQRPGEPHLPVPALRPRSS